MSLFVCSPHIKPAAPFLLPFQLPSWQIFGKIGQKRAKVNFCLLGLVFSRDFRRPKQAKIKHILESGCNEGARWCVPCLPFGVSAGAGVQAFELILCFRGVFPPFYPLYCFALGAFPLKYAFIRILRGFLAWFGVVVWVCSSCVLCVACVVFVRVWS